MDEFDQFMNSFSTFTFFLAQPWQHAWERQQEITFWLSQSINNDIQIVSPLGQIEYSFFSRKFAKKVLEKIKIHEGQNGNNKIGENFVFKNFPIFLHKFDSISTAINIKLLNKKIEMSNNNFFYATYVNPAIYEYLMKSKFTILDIAERRQKNVYLSDEIKKLEIQAVKAASIVIVDNKATYNDYKTYNENIFYIPQGYNTSEFPMVSNAHRTKVGYIGHFHEHIDYDYLEKLVKLNSDREFLLIGKKLVNDIDRILEYDNVSYHEEVPKSELSNLMKDMEFGLIPYKVDDFTDGVFPTKLFEYLGMGIQVIATELSELAQYGKYPFVNISNDPSVIKTGTKINYDELTKFLEENTWESRMTTYKKRIMEVVKNKQI